MPNHHKRLHGWYTSTLCTFLSHQSGQPSAIKVQKQAIKTDWTVHYRPQILDSIP